MMRTPVSGGGRIVAVFGLLFAFHSSASFVPAAPAEKLRVAVESPLRPVDAQPEGLVTRLAFDADRYREIKSAQSAVLTRFVLERAREVDLEMERVEIFAEGATIVLGTPTGDMPVPQPDVVLLQELKVTDENFPAMEIEELGYNCAVHGQKTYNGVAILSKHPLDDVRTGLPGDDGDEQARYVEAWVDAGGGAVVNLEYASPRSTCPTAIRSTPTSFPTSSVGWTGWPTMRGAC